MRVCVRKKERSKVLTISTVVYCDSVSFYLIVEKPHESDVYA